MQKLWRFKVVTYNYKADDLIQIKITYSVDGDTIMFSIISHKSIYIYIGIQ